MNAYLDALRRYFDFSGRSTRSQFWLFTLGAIMASIAALIVDGASGSGTAGEPGLVTSLVLLGHLIPSLSVMVRRLHDIDRSGWWVLLGLVPLVGSIVLLVFACTASTAGANRFGPHPMGKTEPPTPAPAPAAQSPSQGTTLPALAALAVVLALGTPSPVSAAEHHAPLNAIYRVYTDYCDPEFFGRAYLGDGAVDPQTYQLYERQLFVQHGSNCTRFYYDEVLVSQYQDRLLTYFPEAFPAGRSTLARGEQSLLGTVLWTRWVINEGGCQIGENTSILLAQEAVHLQRLLDALTYSDARRVGSGAAAVGFMIFGMPIPIDVTAAELCDRVAMAANLIAQSLTSQRLVPPETFANR